MLVEFSATNFRSYRETQTLSMVRGKLRDDDKLESHSFPFPDKNEMGLLCSAAIYGANASGKSNLIRALGVMQKVVKASAGWQRGEGLPVTPFALTKETIVAPSEFEITFYKNGTRFQYGFSATQDKVIEEWLFAYPNGRSQSWIEREWDENTQSYNWGRMEALKGQKKLWKDSTKGNSLFLSTAVQLNCEQLQPVFDWFESTLRIAGIKGLDASYTAKLCKEESVRKEVMQFLQSADLNIADIHIENRALNPDDIQFAENMPLPVREHFLKNMLSKDYIDIKLRHKGEGDSSMVLELDDESDGTQKLFSFAGPWLDVLKNGRVLFVDELHDNLHPLIVRMLVKLFHSKKTNPNNAQLLFTTHETSIMSQDVFRRDQVWFASQEGSNGTYLTPLSDFRVRKGVEDIERHYLNGRYGAVPYLSEPYADVAVSMGH